MQHSSCNVTSFYCFLSNILSHLLDSTCFLAMHNDEEDKMMRKTIEMNEAEYDREIKGGRKVKKN